MDSTTPVRETSFEDVLHHRLALALAALCGFGVIAGYALGHFGASDTLSHAAFVVAYLAGGSLAAKESWHQLRQGHVDVHFLMLLVAVGAWTIHAHEEGSILLFLFSLSGALESFAEYRTKKAVSALYKNYPKEARRWENGEWKIVPLEALQVGDDVLVRPGDLFPTDGKVKEGESFADESALTGEAMPVAKRLHDLVSGGTLNLDGQLRMIVGQLPSESAVQKVIRLVNEARRSKAPAQRMTDIIGSYYTWAILVLSVLAYIYFQFGSDLPARDAFYSTMVLLVVASPCALVLSIPSSILTTIAAGARKGILFQGGRAVEELARVNVFALDKTGTITKGRFAIRSMSARNIDDNELLRLTASVENASSHPLAHGIVRTALEKGIKLSNPSDIRNFAGEGIEGVVDGEKIRVGKKSFVSVLNADIPDANYIAGDGQVFVATATAAGVILLRDELRPGAQDAVRHLRGKNEVVLLSGDKGENVEELAREVGITDYAGDLSPEDKLTRIKKLRDAGKLVAMTGDGINDAPSLAAAHVSIVMGDRGSDAAMEEADIVLMGGGIMQLPKAVELSVRARQIIWQNLFLSVSTVVVLVIAALNRELSLPVGVIGHEGSTVVVVLNSLRLLRSS